MPNWHLKSGRGKHSKFLSFAFTEHGAIMAANVLSSPKAVQMSVFVVRHELKGRLDVHESAIVDVLQHLMKILDPAPEPEPPRREIGFHAKDDIGAKSGAK
jgi:hypothetical protein